MPAPVIAAGIGGASSLLGGLFSKPKTQTSTTTPTFSPEMQQLQSQLMAYSQEQMTDPSKGFAPIRQAGLDNINRAYIGAGNRVSSQLASRGYGASGDVGNSLYRTELARGGAMSDFEGQLAQAQINQKNVGAGLGEQLLSLGRGSTTTGTGPGGGLGDGLMSGGNALGNLAGILSFNNYLKQAKSGSGQVTNFDPYGGNQESVTGRGSGIGGL